MGAKMNNPKLNQEVLFFDDYNTGGRPRVCVGKITGCYRPLPNKIMFIVDGSGSHVYREADALYTSVEEIKEELNNLIVNH